MIGVNWMKVAPARCCMWSFGQAAALDEGVDIGELLVDFDLVTFDPIGRFILIEHFGVVDLAAIEKSRSKALVLAKQYECFRVLADLRKASAGISFVEVFKLPESSTKAIADENMTAFSFKRAILLKGDSELATFFEDVSVNRGHNVRLFYDMEDAKAWLGGD